jgi:hypothetical protein
MFKVGDRVRVVTPAFQDTIGTVTGVVPGRSSVISSEFVVQTSDGPYRFFEDQLVPLAEVDTEP